jgi:hypothetical protein
VAEFRDRIKLFMLREQATREIEREIAGIESEIDSIRGAASERASVPPLFYVLYQEDISPEMRRRLTAHGAYVLRADIPRLLERIAAAERAELDEGATDDHRRQQWGQVEGMLFGRAGPFVAPRLNWPEDRPPPANPDLRAYVDPPFQLSDEDYEDWVRRLRSPPTEI